MHHLGRDPPAVGEHDRAACVSVGALRPSRHAERIKALGQQRVPRLLLKQIAEALGAAMRHRKGIEPPAGPVRTGPGETARSR